MLKTLDLLDLRCLLHYLFWSDLKILNVKRGDNIESQASCSTKRVRFSALTPLSRMSHFRPSAWPCFCSSSRLWKKHNIFLSTPSQDKRHHPSILLKFTMELHWKWAQKIVKCQNLFTLQMGCFSIRFWGGWTAMKIQRIAMWLFGTFYPLKFF